MKKILLTIISFLCLQIFCNAQYLTLNGNIFNLFNEDNRNIKIGSEYTFKDHFSLGVSYINSRLSTGRSGTSDYGSSITYTHNISGVMIEGRVYPIEKKRDSPAGFFISGFVKSIISKEHYRGGEFAIQPYTSEVKNNIFMITPGIGTGYQFAYLKRLTTEIILGYGPSILFGERKNTNLIDPFFGSAYGISEGLRFEVSIGIIINKDYELNQED